MSLLRYRPFYRRNLPHYQPEGAILFVTFRLAGSLPHHVVQRLRHEESDVTATPQHADDDQGTPDEQLGSHEKIFRHWDRELDAAAVGPCWLADSRLAREVAGSIHYRDGRVYSLEAFCIMPNHVHMVCTPLLRSDGDYHGLSSILKSLKN